MTKLMAIDYGKRRVGIALSDDSGQFALPHSVLQNNKTLIENVLTLKEKERVDKIIIGESNNLDGKPNPVQKDILKFKMKLERLGAKTALHPEMLTSVEARHTQGQTRMTDASAAALILKSFIDTVYNKNL